MGTYRAVKLVHRKTFKNSKPFDREFEGIKNCEPISRGHSGLVDILHIGKNKKDDYFYYVMELGDDLETDKKFNPSTYKPKTLDQLIKINGRLTLDQCFQYFRDRNIWTDGIKVLQFFEIATASLSGFQTK